MGMLNPDANPLYDREYSSPFLDAWFDDIDRGFFKETHAVFVDPESKLAYVIPKHSDDYYRMRNQNHLLGTETQCREIARHVFD